MLPGLPSGRRRNAEPGFVANPGSQTLFLAAKTFEVLLEGTRGGGKSLAILMAYAQHVGKGYGAAWLGAIFRRTYPELQDIIKKSKSLFPAVFGSACTYNEGRHEWSWTTGEKLLFRHGKVEDDYESYHGWEIPFLGFEELTNWASSAFYTKMFSCCRSGSHPGMPRIVRATTNPSGPGMQWVKKRFRLPEMRFEPFYALEEDENGKMVPSKERMAIFSHFRENTHLMENDPDYEKTLRASAKSQAELRAWLVGDWNVALGGLFSDLWEPDLHVIKPFLIPDGWKVDRALDWGSSRPFAYGLFAESDGNPYYDEENEIAYGMVKGDLFMIGEWYGSTGKPNEGLNYTSEKVAQGIKERELEWCKSDRFGLGLGTRLRIRPGPADHNIFAKDRGPTIASIYKKAGVKFTPADKGPFSRQRGWSVMRDYLFNSTDMERTKGGIWFFNTCQNAGIHIPATTRDPKNTDDTDIEEDHLQDMVRYRCRKIKKTMTQSDG